MNTSCESVRQWLPAFVDGEALPLGRAQLESHLAECAECARRVAALGGFVDGVARAHRARPLPERLRRELERTVRGGGVHDVRRRLVPVLAAAAVLLLITTVALAALRPSAARAATLPEAAVLGHEGVLQGSTPLDVAESDPLALSGWFAARLPFRVHLPRLDNPQLHLRGGRVIQVGGSLAALVVYAIGEEQVSLAVVPRSQELGRPPATAAEVFRDIRFEFTHLRGLHVTTWDDGGLTYSLVSSQPPQGGASCTVCHGPGSGLRGVEGFHEPR